MTAGTLVGRPKNVGDAGRRGGLIAEFDTGQGGIESEVFTGRVIE